MSKNIGADGLTPDQRWYSKNKEKKLATLNKWRKNNPEKMAEQKRRNYIKHRDEKRAKMKNWQIKNQEYVKQYRRQAAIKARGTPERKWASLKSSARKRGLELGFTKESFIEWTKYNDKCCYCGGKLPEVGCGVDRIDSLQGYTETNSAPCCNRCNQAKNNLTVIEFKEHIMRIYEYSIKK